MTHSSFVYTSRNNKGFSDRSSLSTIRRNTSFYSLGQDIAYREENLGRGNDLRNVSVSRFKPEKISQEVQSTVIKEVHIDINRVPSSNGQLGIIKYLKDELRLAQHEVELNRNYNGMGELDVHVQIGDSKTTERILDENKLNEKLQEIKKLRNSKQEMIFYILMKELPFSLNKLEDKIDEMEFKDLLKLYISVLKAVLELHDKYKIVHGDLKASNICCDEKVNITFCDFGLARKLKNYHTNSEAEETLGYDAGNCPHIAPEINGKKVLADPKQDVYSLGELINWIFHYHINMDNLKNKKGGFSEDLIKTYEDNKKFLTELRHSMMKNENERISLPQAIRICVEKYGSLDVNKPNIFTQTLDEVFDRRYADGSKRKFSNYFVGYPEKPKSDAHWIIKTIHLFLIFVSALFSPITIFLKILRGIPEIIFKGFELTFTKAYNENFLKLKPVWWGLKHVFGICASIIRHTLLFNPVQTALECGAETARPAKAMTFIAGLLVGEEKAKKVGLWFGKYIVRPFAFLYSIGGIVISMLSGPAALAAGIGGIATIGGATAGTNAANAITTGFTAIESALHLSNAGGGIGALISKAPGVLSTFPTAATGLSTVSVGIGTVENISSSGFIYRNIGAPLKSMQVPETQKDQKEFKEDKSETPTISSPITFKPF